MNCEPIQRWANQAANTAGKVLGQGKDLFHTTRDRAGDAARWAEKARRREAKRADAYLSSLQGKWHDLVESAGNRFSHAGSGLHGRFHRAEHTLLKVGALFLAVKCFSHRNKPVSEMATSARAHIEERPIESAVIALGVGYALGKLFK